MNSQREGQGLETGKAPTQRPPLTRHSTGSMAETVIEVRDLHKSFGANRVLDGISFQVQRGQTAVVLGRSGTGKSVLLKILIGLLEPSAGRAAIFGREIHRLPEQQRLRERRHIGYVFQGGALFDSLTVRENVGFALDQARIDEATVRQRVRERLDMVGLGHTLDQLPTDLSGGMQKRVALARAIVELPEIVCYDEPTSGLDPLTTDVINQIILRLRAKLGVTSIVVTHDIRSAFTIADHIIMLDQGRIIAQGSPDQIEHCDIPWVQHFLAGRALDGEALDSGAFSVGGLSRPNRAAGISGRRVAVRSGTSVGRLPIPPPVAPEVEAMPPPVRHRKRRATDEASAP